MPRKNTRRRCLTEQRAGIACLLGLVERRRKTAQEAEFMRTTGTEQGMTQEHAHGMWDESLIHGPPRGAGTVYSAPVFSLRAEQSPDGFHWC